MDRVAQARANRLASSNATRNRERTPRYTLSSQDCSTMSRCLGQVVAQSLGYRMILLGEESSWESASR